MCADAGPNISLCSTLKNRTRAAARRSILPTTFGDHAVPSRPIARSLLIANNLSLDHRAPDRAHPCVHTYVVRFNDVIAPVPGHICSSECTAVVVQLHHCFTKIIIILSSLHNYTLLYIYTYILTELITGFVR